MAVLMKKNGSLVSVGLSTPPNIQSQQKTENLNMSSGDQVISPDSGKLLSQVTITKPATLISENIKNGVNIGGVTGSFEGGASLNVEYNSTTAPSDTSKL